MSCVSLATPGTEACDAVGGALRPKCREWPARGIRRVLSERVAFGMVLAALFGFLPSSVRRTSGFVLARYPGRATCQSELRFLLSAGRRSAHFRMASSVGQRDWPHGVRRYSTFGGT